MRRRELELRNVGLSGYGERPCAGFGADHVPRVRRASEGRACV